MRMKWLSIVATVAGCVAGGARGQGPVVYVGGNIYTMDALRPRAEAMAVEGGRIVAVGPDREVRERAGAGAVVHDLGRATVLPGLIDAHGHVAGLGSFGLGRIDLGKTTSYEGVVAEVGEAAARAKPGEWVLGGRWDHESWPSRELPTHTDLSKMTPENPVWLRRVDGHAGIANEAALRAAGITRETASPAGGEIIKDGRGEPTGVLVDNAMSLVERVVRAPLAGTDALILKAQEMCLAAGLTGVHDMGVSPAEVAVYRSLAEKGKLKLRVYAMVSGPYAMKYFEENGTLVGERITVRGAKLYMDGAMGSRGAWLLEPYADRKLDAEGKPYTGLAVSKTELIEAVARHGLERGYQVCTHAIGDRGNREVLDAYERAVGSLGSTPPLPEGGHRFRVDHAQLLSMADIPRFASMGVIPSMQPTHCTSDMRWVEARVGPERARGAYAWASLLRSGARIAVGSDFPVESHNPFLGFYAAVTRQDGHGQPAGGWLPAERMTREETLRAFTLDAAYAAFEEGEKGSLAAGKMADFIVIDRDVMVCPEADILGTRVLRTVIGGEIVFAADSVR